MLKIQEIYKKKYIKYKNKCKQINKKFKGGFLIIFGIIILISVMGVTAGYVIMNRQNNKEENKEDSSEITVNQNRDELINKIRNE